MANKKSLIHQDIPHKWLLSGLLLAGVLSAMAFAYVVVQPNYDISKKIAYDNASELTKVAANDPYYWTCQPFSSIWVNDCRSYNDYVNKSPKCRMNVKTYDGETGASGIISYKTTGPKEAVVYGILGMSKDYDCNQIYRLLENKSFNKKIGEKLEVNVYDSYVKGSYVKVGDPVKWCVAFRDLGAPGRAKLPDLHCEAFTNFMR